MDINLEKKKLDKLIELDAPYNEILKQSQIVDKCIIEWYKEKEFNYKKEKRNSKN